MITSIRVKKETKDILNDLKGSRTADEYIKDALLYFRITKYDPKDIVYNPVLDMGAIFNRRFDQLKGMVVNFQKENNIRFDKVDNAIIERGIAVVNKKKVDEHVFTNEELNEMNDAISALNKREEESKRKILLLESELRKEKLKRESKNLEGVNIQRLANLTRELDKYMKLDRFDTSGSTMVINKDVYNLRMVEMLKLLSTIE